MEDKNKKMDAALEARVQALDAASDETGDGKVDWQDLKSQLNRIEAQLELQDRQNRSIMKNQRLRLILSVVLAVVLVGAVAFLWLRTNAAYEKILVTCEQVNQLAETVEGSLNTRDKEELDQLMQDLPYLFDRYYRARQDAGRAGTGLGLSITKAILQQHGFAFGVNSAVGQGSTFWFEMRDTRHKK